MWAAATARNTLVMMETGCGMEQSGFPQGSLNMYPHLSEYVRYYPPSSFLGRLIEKIARTWCDGEPCTTAGGTTLHSA